MTPSESQLKRWLVDFLMVEGIVDDPRLASLREIPISEVPRKQREFRAEPLRDLTEKEVNTLIEQAWSRRHADR